MFLNINREKFEFEVARWPVTSGKHETNFKAVKTICSVFWIADPDYRISISQDGLATPIQESGHILLQAKERKRPY